MKKFCLIKVLVASVVSVFLGALVAEKLASDNYRDALVIQALHELAQQEQFAVTAFKQLDPDSVIFIQENLIVFARNRYEIGWLDQPELNRVTGFATARSGIAYLEIGQEEKSAKMIEEAISLIKKSTLDVDGEELMSMLKNQRSNQ